MDKKKGLWKGSVKVLKNPKAIVITGMLLALHLVLALALTLPLTDSLRISVAFITNVVTGYLYGPWMAMITGALGDVLQLMIKPTGAWFFGWTLNAALGGLLYGMFFYRKAPKEMNAGVPSEQQQRRVRVAELASAAVALLMLGVWFVMPFVTVMTKATAEQPVQTEVISGSAFRHMMAFLQGEGNKTTGIIATALLVIIIAIIALAVLRKKVLVMLLSIMALLWQLLPVYNERKYMEAEYGFVLLAAGLVLCMAAMLVSVLWQRSLDGMYLLRSFLVMAVVAVVIQMLLGTIWCTVMYGKGFWFYFVPRCIKSLIQLPFNTVLAYYVIAAVKRFKLGE